jgi:hypothetical protein
MLEDVTLAAGTIVEHFDSDGVWKRVPRITSTGDTGSLAEAKEKTTTEDRIKRYGSGLRDGGDKNFKGQIIPPQAEGSEHYLDRALQQIFLDRCKNEEEMPMRITFPDSERGTFTFKSLGYLADDVTAEDWRMFSANGKQNSFVAWSTAPLLTAVVLGGTGTLTVGNGEQLTVANTPIDAFYEVNQDSYVSDDPAVVSVTKWGYVKGVSAGTANIEVTRTTGDGTTVTDTLEIVVS